MRKRSLLADDETIFLPFFSTRKVKNWWWVRLCLCVCEKIKVSLIVGELDIGGKFFLYEGDTDRILKTYKCYTIIVNITIIDLYSCSKRRRRKETERLTSQVRIIVLEFLESDIFEK